MHRPTIGWNENVRLVISDVDETIARVYEPAEPEMVDELSSVLDEGVKFLMVSGGSLAQVNRRVIDYVPLSLRQGIIVGHCNGAETWGFTKSGTLRDEPFYSAYEDNFADFQKEQWRVTIAQLLGEFGLRRHTVRPVDRFTEEVGTHPLDVMYEDRGPQITLEMANAYNLSEEQAALLQAISPHVSLNGARDLRQPLIARANDLFEQVALPVTARLGGVFAVDLAVRGVTKATAVHHTLDNPQVLESVGLDSEGLQDPGHIEIWGDKFSKASGGTDSYMSEAVSPSVRSIDFRDERPNEFISGYNIVLWNGERHLQDGLLEYLQSR